ncbi:rho GTPase-activating protein 2-like [Mangifera indica]|uniref:rho GTPase-activating protein 2-like n=1 Tax=Mangifera indica TaxID=29780 RepID=UPI001CF9749C|nr:rho GTPase-activating protein 2-like [Mangifera indica]
MTGLVMVRVGCGGGGGGGGGGGKGNKGTRSRYEEQNQLSLAEVLIAALKKSMMACHLDRDVDVISTVDNMEIGWPTNVEHIAHVTFDPFNGFLGLPVEFEVEVPCQVPSASASVFGVSAESMQCSFDSRGNSVPTILLLMQERLYSQGGLKAEGIFRINPENSQEEHVRDQLNRGVVPDNIDVHCLAGLIKAWFRELPSGVLDGLSPEQVLDCNTEEESVELVKQLRPTEAALLNWAVELMADVVEEEESNKMNARNIAMVFAPNMTQMSDPLTALMHAVQVMNLLKTLITKSLREREDTETGGYSPMSSHSSDRETDEEYDSQQEMNSSCELRGPTSEYDDNAHYSHSSGDEDETEPLGEIEECFLRQLDENKNIPNGGCLKQPMGDLQGEYASSRNFSGFTPESGISFTDSKNENSSSCSSDAEDSRTSLIAVEQKTNKTSPSKGNENTKDVEMVEKLVESASITCVQ